MDTSRLRRFNKTLERRKQMKYERNLENFFFVVVNLIAVRAVHNQKVIISNRRYLFFPFFCKKIAVMGRAHVRKLVKNTNEKVGVFWVAYVAHLIWTPQDKSHSNYVIHFVRATSPCCMLVVVERP
jgi:hypothetical protein